jgi:hypothetical protein
MWYTRIAMDRNRALIIGLLIGGVLAVSTWGITHLVRSGTLPFLRARVEVPTTPTPFAPPGATPGTAEDTPSTAEPEPADPFTGAAQVFIDLVPSP